MTITLSITKSVYEPQPIDSGRVGGEVHRVPQQGLGRNHRSLPIFRGAATCELNMGFGLDRSEFTSHFTIHFAFGKGPDFAEPQLFT